MFSAVIEVNIAVNFLLSYCTAYMLEPESAETENQTDIFLFFLLSGLLPGCTGALARELARVYPSSSVTVLDLPQVVATAQKHFPQEDDAVTFQAGELRLIL